MAGTSELLGPVLTLSDSTNKDGKIILNGKEAILGRNIGEIVYSALPLSDAGLVQISVSQSPLTYGSYKAFIDYIASIYSTYSSLFVTDAQWTSIYNEFGACGKFVYNSTNKTVRLPVINNFIEGATSISELGQMTEAGIPNIKGEIKIRGTYGNGVSSVTVFQPNGVFSAEQSSAAENSGVQEATDAKRQTVKFNASSGEVHNGSYSNEVYGKSDTVQPQSVKLYVYLVVANSSKSDYLIDVDQVMADVNSLRIDVANTKRNIGELVYSSIPLVDAGLKLANGQALPINGSYSDFCGYILDLYNSSSPCVTTGTSADTGKYVYDSAGSRIFLPNLNNLFIEGTTTASQLGSSVAAGLPNITGDWMGSGLTYGAPQNGSSENYEGALYGGYATERAVSGVLGGNPNYRSDIGQDHIAFDASRSNSIYGNSSTVQPPAVKQYIYIVVANSVKPNYVIDVDNVMTDLDTLSNRIETTNIANIGIKVDDYHLTEFSGNCNDITKTGSCFTRSATNTPPSTSNGYLVTLAYTNDFIKQIYYPFDSRYEYVRVKTNSGWYSWYCEDLNIWSRLGSYNSTSDYPSASVKSALNAKFQSTSDYSAFYGGDSAAEEFAVYGFRHNSSKGGIAIIMSVAFGIMAGSGSGLPSTWTWRKIWQI